MRIFLSGMLFVVLTALSGCSTKHEIDSRSQVALAPVEVKPIHITIDINIKVDRALDNFFDDLDETQAALKEGEAVK